MAKSRNRSRSACKPATGSSLSAWSAAGAPSDAEDVDLCSVSWRFFNSSDSVTGIFSCFSNRNHGDVVVLRGRPDEVSQIIDQPRNHRLRALFCAGLNRSNRSLQSKFVPFVIEGLSNSIRVKEDAIVALKPHNDVRC